MNTEVKVIRDYSGEEGEGPNKDVVTGRVLLVSRARAAGLIANKLAVPTTATVEEAHPSLITGEQPVATVESFPSGGVTSVAPVNQADLGDGTHALTTDTTPAAQETTLTTIDRADAAPVAGEKAVALPANKKARAPANKAAPAPVNKDA